MRPAKLTYAALRLRGITRRFLFCTTEEAPHFGDPTFDFLFYFGFGSGEFQGQHPPIYDNLRVRVEELSADDYEIKKSQIASWFERPTDGFSGFFTHDGIQFTILHEDPEGIPISKIPEFDWSYYTQVGDRGRGYSMVQALKRKHILFETHQQQNDLLTLFGELVIKI